MSADGFAAALAADMARLSQRPYAEVGVPMFLIAEDLADGAPVAPDPAWPPVAAEFAEMAATVGDLPDPMLARVVEVLADRHILGDAGAFTRLRDRA